MDDYRSPPRFIPRRTRVKTEFVKGVTGGDLAYIGTGMGVTFLVGVSGLGPWNGIMLAILVFGLFGIGFLKTNDTRLFLTSVAWFRFLAYTKKYAKLPGAGYKDIFARLVPYKGIKDNVFIDFVDYSGIVVEIQPIEFMLLEPMRQDGVVNTIADALRRLGPNQHASLIRLERALVLDKYIDYEVEKYEAVIRNVELGVLTEEELDAREVVFNERGALLEYMNDEERVYKSCFYMVIYGKERDILMQTAEGISQTLMGSLENKILEGKELAIFLRANYNKEFEERDLDDMPDSKFINWIVPNKVEFSTGKYKINGLARQALKISDYPLDVSNAWGYTLFNMPGTRTVMNFHQVPKLEAEKIIDRALVEMRTQMEQSSKASFQIDRQTQFDSVQDLLVSLKQNNEALFDCTIHFSVEWDDRKELKAKLREEGYKVSELSGKQIDGFLSANVSQMEHFTQFVRGIPTTTVAASMPMISDMLQDDKGICFGNNSYPVFIDFFKRSNSRVNSNMIVIGKSGSGKSFATKSLLAHLAADNTKIFICDPEKEYVKMAEKLHGNVIDVGNAGKGRFNPFHIYPAMLEDADGGGEYDDTYESHLRFLESFFKIVLEGIRSDALEALNGLVAVMYRLKGIDNYTDFNACRPENFPTFQDLYLLAREYHNKSTDDFSKINYRILVTYLEKFAEGGRYSGLWNGPASITAKENFTCFNFLTLLANKNAVVANAQMLLVFKFLDGEIIKNREFNAKNKAKRKIIIVVDEAHVFIDEQRPIALDFMFQMAKRIRKYDGMQIIITQNIKDFVGSPVIAKKSAAIINASQYSMIFSLAPNDMTDLVTLYKNAGGINKQEQNQIVSASRGRCFFISGPTSRTQIMVETSDEMRQLFE
jgi:hypothetical protein